MWEREVPPAPFVPGEETKGDVAEAVRKWARYHRKADPISAGVESGVKRGRLAPAASGAWV